MKPALLVAAIALLGCGGYSRFSLRPPVTHTFDVPFSHEPEREDESDVTNAVDGMALRPLANAFAFRVGREAIDVNAVDEVPDSSWFENRAVAPEALERGPCPKDGPVAPFVVSSTKVGGVTPGFVVKDARGQKYVLKLDELGKYGQPEISTGADVIASRLYWAIGFNVPCNDIIEASATDLRVGPGAKEVNTTGQKKPLTAARIRELLKSATRTRGGLLRLSASRFIEGNGIGTWRSEGRRPDDPNDAIPHEDRRELRGELFLAAWTAHWDSRGQNTYDTFVRGCGGGHVVHYFLDFSDALGGTVSRTAYPEPRSGYESVLSFGNIATDAIGFGFVRRPWDDLKIDPLYPDLGYLDVEHFDPLDFSPQTPLARWARVEPQDLAWMARRIARIGVDHVRVAVSTGHLTRPGEAPRLVEILMGRRARVLALSFARVSPLADLAFAGDTLCATDLARATKIADDAKTSYAAVLHFGEGLGAAELPALTPTAAGVCARLPRHFAPKGAAKDAASRYAVLDLVRIEGRARTTLRAHYYDLGDRYVLVGVERP